MARFFASVGNVLRSVGRSLDNLGASVQGKCGYVERLVPTLTGVHFGESKPIYGNGVFVAPNATVVGDVTIGDRTSIWYGSVIRGDVHGVKIGEQTNLQDNVVVHVARNPIPPAQPLATTIGSHVTVGHGAVLHACTIADKCLVGMGATLLDGVKMESNSIVAAGALVPPGTVIGTGEVWAGSPAKLLRQLTAEEIEFVVASAGRYAELAEWHSEENSKTFDQIVFDKNLRRDRQTRGEDYDSHMGIIRDPKTREIKYMAPI